jgi:hypothetical protein
MSDEGNDESQNYASHADRLKAILKAHEPEINRLRASQGAGQKKPASKPSVSAAARRVETRRDREARQAELVEREREAQADALFAQQEGKALQTRIVFSDRAFRSDDLRPQRREAQQTRQAAEAAGTYIPKKIRTPKAPKETVRRTPVALSIVPGRGGFIAVEDSALLADILSSARAYRIGSRQSLFDHAKRIKAKAKAGGIEVSGRALRKSILAARPELSDLAEGKTKFRTAEAKLVKIKPPKVEEVDSTEDERRIRRLQAAARRKALKDAGLLPLPKRSSKPNSSERTAKAASRIYAQVDDLPDPAPETTPSDARRQRREAANLQRQERTAAELRPLLECFVTISATGKSGAEDSRMARLSDLLEQHPEDRVLAQELAKLLRLASNPTEAAKVLWGRETFPRIYTADDLQRDIDRKIRLGEFLEISTCLRAGRKSLAAATLLETVVAEFPESEEARLQLGLIRRPGEFTIEGSGDKKKIAQGHRKSVETLLPLIASPTHGEMAVASIIESKLALDDTQSALRWAEFRRPTAEDEPLGRLLTVAKFAHGLKTADIDLVEEALAHLPQHILKVGKKGIHLDFSSVVTTAQGLHTNFHIADYGFSPVVRLAEALLRCQRNEEAFLLFREGDLLAKKDEKDKPAAVDAETRTDRLRGYLAGGISYLRRIDSSKQVAELQEHSGDSAAANKKFWDKGYRQAFCYLLQAYRVDRNHVELNAALRHVMAVTQNPAMARALKLEQDRQSKQADELLEQLRLGREKAAEPVVVAVEGNRQREQAERPPHRATPTKRPRTSVPAMVS